MTQGHWVGNKFWQFYKKKGPFWPTWPRGPPGTFRTLISSRFGLKVFVLMNYHRNIGVFPSLNSVCRRVRTVNSWSYNNLRIPSLINVLSCIKLIIQMHLNVSQGKAGEEQESLWCPLTKAWREVSTEYQQPHWTVREDMEQITQRERKCWQSYQVLQTSKGQIHWLNWLVFKDISRKCGRKYSAMATTSDSNSNPTEFYGGEIERSKYIISTEDQENKKLCP